MNNAAPQDAKITKLDLRIAISVLICVLTATLLDYFGLRVQIGESKLEVIQKMTAAISCLLLCQDSIPVTKKAGINRLIITAIGGLVGIVVILLDNVIGNSWIMCFMIAVGVLAVLLTCKVCKVPYINCRIGGVTFILVACTLRGDARIHYGIFRLVSTLYSAIIVMLVTYAASALGVLEEK